MIKSSVFAMLFLALIYSCNKDSDNSTTNNLIIDGDNLSLDKAILQNWGRWNGMDQSYDSSRIIIGIYSPEVYFTTLDGEVESIHGIGNGVEFEMFVESPQNISKREFILSSDYTPNTISGGVVYINFPFENGNFLDGNGILEGTFILEVNKSILSIEAHFTLVGGEKVSLTYTDTYIYLETEEK